MKRCTGPGCGVLRMREENIMNSMARGLATAVSAAVLVATPTHALAATRVTVEQGAAISVGLHGMCTLGYNDHTKGVSYTAAHCGNDGDPVYLVDPTTNNVIGSTSVGTFHPSEQYSQIPYNDWATITWNSDVTLGENIYSGDTILAQGDVVDGDEVCVHGETSHAGTHDTSCGIFAGWSEEAFAMHIDRGRPGDSGGPVWVPGRGLVGVMSLAALDDDQRDYSFTNGTVTESKPAGWGAALRDGRTASEMEFAMARLKAAGIELPEGDGEIQIFDPSQQLPTQPPKAEQPEETPAPENTNEPTPTVEPQQKAPVDEESSPSGSSLSTGGIIALVVGLLVAAVIPVALQFL